MSDTEHTKKEHLPAFTTWEECLAFAHEKRDNFYVDVFMIEAWIGDVIANAVEQYAENKSGHRHLQTGTGWKGWQSVFGHAKPEEWGHILHSLARFGNCDTGEGEIVNRMFHLTGTEDKHGEPVLMSSFVQEIKAKKVPAAEIVGRMRYTFQRLAEWLEAIIHWQTHWLAAVTPITFQATEERRELASIGLMQAGFAALNEHGKTWWRFRHDELAKQFQGNPDWRLVGKVQSQEKFGELRQPAVDELTIHWWPLLNRYRWTDHDMRGLLRRVVPHPDAYPLRDDKEFADYRQKALGLIKGNEKRDKSAPDGKPTGWRVALAMADKLSE